MNPSELPPSAQLMNLLWGKAVTTSLSAIADLGVADHMGDEPVTAAELAAKTGAHADSLYRVMRMVASLGVFQELPGQRFALTPMGRCLREDAPDSQKATAIMVGDPWQMRGYENIRHAVKTGQDGITAAYGKNGFEVLAELPDQEQNFQRCMSAYSRLELMVLAPILDFSAFERVADVGGGYGMLLGHLLRQHPALQGVLFDLPHVVAGAQASPFLSDLGGRASFEPGSMFDHVPAGCDAYIMKHIIHDWSDEHCHRILSLMSQALAAHAPENGRVFLAEMIVPEGPEPAPAKFLDIEMLTLTPGGRERTVPEFGALFARAGLQLVGVKTTQGPIALIEARVAQ
jgi:hypothetical protein